MGFLASRDGEALTSVIMAKSFGTSPVLLRRVLARLNQSGLVDTRRGANGGSVLARPAADITLREVYESVCLKQQIFKRHPEGDGAISKVLGNYINDFYEEAEQSMLLSLESVSVADMDEVVRPKIMSAIKCS